MREEISSIFKHLFALGEHELIQYDYLTTVPGMKRLKKPNVSTTFSWNGQEVASLAGQGSLYVVAKSALKCKVDLREVTYCVFTLVLVHVYMHATQIRYCFLKE